MKRFRTVLNLTTYTVVAALSSVASGQDVLSFTYSDLNGSFDTASSTFTAIDDFDTDGDVTRLIDPIGDAFFAGTLADGGFAMSGAFDLSLTLSNITLLGADSVGTLTIVDLTGDQITADVTGNWLYNGSANFFGLLNNVAVVDISGDGTFDGDSGSSFSLAFPDQLAGNTIALAFGTWFTNDLGGPQGFSGVTTLASGAVIPEPTTLALLALGGLIATARKRRR